MALVTLKSLLARKKETATVLRNLLGLIDASLVIEDNEGRVLIGAAEKNNMAGQSIQVNGDILGYVKVRTTAKETTPWPPLLRGNSRSAPSATGGAFYPSPEGGLKKSPLTKGDLGGCVQASTRSGSLIFK